MAQMFPRALTNNYLLTSLGLLLFVQVLQVLPSKLPDLHHEIDKPAIYLYDSAKIFINDNETSVINLIHKENASGENEEDNLYDSAVRTGRQMGTDDRANNDDSEWKSFVFMKNKINTDRQYYNQFSFNKDVPTREIPDESRVVFPDDDTVYKKPFRPNIPMCKDSVICENAPNYPIDIVEKQLAEKKYLKHLQTHDKVPEITTRIGNENYDSLCFAEEGIIHPRVALTLHNKYMYVVNADNFVQAIRVEICRNKNGPCRLIDGFVSGYKTICEQKYIYRQLLGIHKNGTLGVEYFQIPSSCCCQAKFVGDTWERIGKGRESI